MRQDGCLFCPLFCGCGDCSCGGGCAGHQGRRGWRGEREKIVATTCVCVFLRGGNGLFLLRSRVSIMLSVASEEEGKAERLRVSIMLSVASEEEGKTERSLARNSGFSLLQLLGYRDNLVDRLMSCSYRRSDTYFLEKAAPPSMYYTGGFATVIGRASQLDLVGGSSGEEEIGEFAQNAETSITIKWSYRSGVPVQYKLCCFLFSGLNYIRLTKDVLV